ncbi:UNVERIFIED_ORG: putative helicase [Arthrobacter sp. UYCu721]
MSEFHDIYVYNLRGNQRTAGEQSRREGGKVFDSGSRNTVAILLLVKRPGTVTSCALHYRDIGDYLDRKAKLAIVDAGSVADVPWEAINPSVAGDWINHRNAGFEVFASLSAKAGDKTGIFGTHSRGLATARDAWIYNSSRPTLGLNLEAMVTFYNDEVRRYANEANGCSVDGFINVDPRKFSWNRADKTQLKNGVLHAIGDDGYRQSSYRPFQKQNVHFSRQLNDMIYQLGTIYPSSETHNIGFYISGSGSTKPFSCLMTDLIPDVNLYGSEGGQFFPRYTYSATARGTLFAAMAEGDDNTLQQVDNVTDAALSDYRSTYGPEVSKDDIFHYVYGLLHSPEYRTTFEADLKKMLPRIPQVPGAERFQAFVEAGKALSDLHIGYESSAPYPLTEVTTGLAVEKDDFAFYEVTKMKYAGKAGAWDKTRIIYNSHLTLEGIPAEAQQYMLGSRSAVDWILERYQVKTDKASGIVNDPNDWSREHGLPRYIIDLIGRIVALSLETNRIVDSLPELELD